MLLIERANRALESKNIKSVSISKILILKLFYGPGFENCLVARLLISKFCAWKMYSGTAKVDLYKYLPTYLNNKILKKQLLLNCIIVR